MPTYNSGDIHLPVMSMIAALICLGAVCLFFSQFYKGIGLCIKLLQLVIVKKTEDTNYLEDYRVYFAVLATITFIFACVIVLTEYLHTDARYAQNPICQFCEGRIPIMVLMFGLLILAAIWLYAFFKLDQLSFFCYIIDRECKRNETNVKIGKKGECSDIKYFVAWFPPETDLKICGDKLKEICVDFIAPSQLSIQLTSLACAIVVVSIGCMIMSSASILAIESDPERELDDIQSVQSARSNISRRRFQ